MYNTIKQQTASVRFRRQVLNPDDTPAGDWSDWKNNLILDVGLDSVCGGNNWFSQIDYLATGDGALVTKRDSGTITFSRAGNTVTASGAFFEAADVNRRLKFDSGEVMKITAFGSNTSVAVDASGTLASSEGTVWYTNATGLVAEFGVRTATVSTDSGANADTFIGGVWTRRRTFVTGVFAATKTVREVGWSRASSGTLFGMSPVPGGGDAVPAGKKYKLQLELSVDYSPKTPVALTEFGVGMSSLGYFSQERTPAPSAGSFVSAIGGSSSYIWATSTAQTPLSISDTVGNGRGVAVGNYGGSVSWLPYTSGTFKRTARLFWDELTANGSNITCFFVESAGSQHGWAWYPATPQTKTNAYELEILVEVTAGRALNN